MKSKTQLVLTLKKGTPIADLGISIERVRAALRVKVFLKKGGKWKSYKLFP